MGKGALSGRSAQRRIWWAAGGIVVLALVIFVGAAISTPKRSAQPTTIELSSVEQAAALATQAEVAASQEQTATARQLAGKALKLDATNATAKAVIATLDAAAKPIPQPVTKPAGKPATKPTDPGPDAYVAGVKDVSTLLPSDIAGWVRGMVSVQGGEGVVTYEPTVKNDVYPNIVRVAVYVHDMQSSQKASTFVDKVDKRAYSSGGTAVKIGTLTAYSGSDGARLAVVAFTRGRYAFEVLANGKSSADIATMLSVAKTMAGSVPATK